MSESQVRYLGDGVYAEKDVYGIRIYASNGVKISNEIFLDHQSIHKLIMFTDLLWKPEQVVAHHELKKEWEK